MAMSSLSTTVSVAEAADNGSGNDQSFTVVIPKDLPDGVTNTNTNLSLEEIKSNLKKYKGFTNSDLKKLTNDEIMSMGQYSTPDPYGYLKESKVGASAVAKGVLKAWKKIPKPIKKQILKHCGSLGALLDTIDHVTGTSYHIIYSALRHFNVPKSTARVITKVITLFI